MHMIAMDLIPTIPGRPSVVKVGNVTLYVSVHDEAFNTEVMRLYKRVLATHPDKPVYMSKFTKGGGRATLQTTRPRKPGQHHNAICQLACFLARERDGYYKSAGLLPPDWKRWARWARPGRVRYGAQERDTLASIRGLLAAQETA